MAATGVAAMLSSSPRSHPAKQWGTSRGTLPSCARVNIVACISPICDYECVTPTGNTHDNAGPCFITNARSVLHILVLSLIQLTYTDWKTTAAIRTSTNKKKLSWIRGAYNRSKGPPTYQRDLRSVGILKIIVSHGKL